MANQINWRDKVKFSVGDTIAVHQTITEGDKSRTQIFVGLVMRIKGHKGLKTFTVRKIAANNVAVEKIFPELTPTVSKIEIKKTGKVRRAVLSYLRKKVGKKASKVKDVFVKKTKEEVTEVSSPKVETKVEKEKVREEAPRSAKREKTEKPKKVKKGPKKIVRKERKFVR